MNAISEVLWQGIQSFCAQKRYEIFFGEQLAHPFGDKDEAIARRIRSANQDSLSIDILTVSADKCCRGQGLLARLIA
ncbi:MAG: hypothetical protein WA728_00020 [Xanthobacteraceae bacterium]